MLKNKTIAVVVPAYNEESQIAMVIETMPDFVDRMIVVNDCSKDRTRGIVEGYWSSEFNKGIFIPDASNQKFDGKYERANRIVQELRIVEEKYFVKSEMKNAGDENERIILINHLKNSGKGAGVASGYKWARDHNIDCIATMDGDGQMDPAELFSICRPILDNEVDYVKGNRLIHRSSMFVIPKIRFFGNSILSILTKLSSGYWRVSDTQTGYTAISLKALQSLSLHKIYKNYGYPNDMLVKLNIAYCTIKEIEIKPVYQIGENSKMKIGKVIPRVSWLLFRSFFKRLWIKYLFRDFHPLFLLYNMSFILFIISFPYLLKILNHAFILKSQANPVTVLAFIFLAISAFQSLLFAMWMDIQDNDRLYKD